MYVNVTCAHLEKDRKTQRRTPQDTHRFDFTWTIENFSFCAQELGKYLRSSTFRDDEQHTKWCLDLYPKGDRTESKDYLALFLRLLPNQKTTTPVIAKFKLCILKANGEHTNVFGSIREAIAFGTINWAWGRNKIVHRDILFDPQNEMLQDDQLTIFCEVSMVVDTANMSSQSESPSIPQFRLSDDMGALLEVSSSSDCVLCSGSGDCKEFKVHKNVQACRSPVFAAMFTNDTEEKRTGRVQIEDISAPVLGQLLHFVYTGCAPKLLAEEVMADGLLAAADKYQLDRLKAISEQQLSIGMNKENVCAMLALADLHSAEHLKSRAIEYINRHAEEVTESEGWPALVSSRPELLKQVLKFKALTLQRPAPSQKISTSQQPQPPSNNTSRPTAAG